MSSQWDESCRDKLTTQGGLTNVLGALYASVLFFAIINALVVQPVISAERAVSYRERAAGMYSFAPWVLALVPTASLCLPVGLFMHLHQSECLCLCCESLCMCLSVCMCMCACLWPSLSLNDLCLSVCMHLASSVQQATHPAAINEI